MIATRGFPFFPEGRCPGDAERRLPDLVNALASWSLQVTPHRSSETEVESAAYHKVSHCEMSGICEVLCRWSKYIVHTAAKVW
ncbi:hypothetical protein M404DRAFT_1004894 [Pisolithus tinctorius Marx 270]|uniref:Uncharacterized protein n=1 Tax=Pisolithus tinctorius Marx 270 TaxID=870435 RepID=A0A0C3IQJ1_PISTI|nr:hypothetical protein M404DRAFT_1009042 [Pisolithus tinctorius Marx 270]KIN99217.1 hypothetical protein M404DRAFT_1004894 [Pisolithus tinctorius Marx 270]